VIVGKIYRHEAGPADQQVRAALQALWKTNRTRYSRKGLETRRNRTIPMLRHIRRTTVKCTDEAKTGRNGSGRTSAGSGTKRYANGTDKEP
jgi:hypothetical protein